MISRLFKISIAESRPVILGKLHLLYYFLETPMCVSSKVGNLQRVFWARASYMNKNKVTDLLSSLGSHGAAVW